VTIQNVAITFQIIYYGAGGAGSISTAGRSKEAAARRGKVLAMGVGMAVVGGSLFSERIIPAGASASSLQIPGPAGRSVKLLTNAFLFRLRVSTVTFLQAACVPISLLSKAPQIASNHRLKSTGTLSAFAVFNALLGCLARVFTTATEVKDSVVLWGFILAAVLNAVIVFQMVVYWNNAPAGGSAPIHSLGGSTKASAPSRLAVVQADDASYAASDSPLSPILPGDVRRRVSENGELEEKNVGVPPSPVGIVPAKRWARKAD
jgi:hypothetical protein